MMLPPFVIQPSPAEDVSCLAVNFGGAAGVRCASALAEQSATASAAKVVARFTSIRIRSVSLSVLRARGLGVAGSRLQDLGDLVAVRNGPALHGRGREHERGAAE